MATDVSRNPGDTYHNEKDISLKLKFQLVETEGRARKCVSCSYGTTKQMMELLQVGSYHCDDLSAQFSFQ